MSKADLDRAKRAKDDEFYTQLRDIDDELKHYAEHFKGKVVYCNCDDPTKSNFVKYFIDNFHSLEIKKLIATCYQPINILDLKKHDGSIVYDGDTSKNLQIISLRGDGDYRSRECVELLKEADIVVTNPPFSLFRPYIAQLIKYDKKFIIIGSLNAISYKEIFPLIKDNKLWLGYNGSGHTFIKPDGSEHKLGFTTWWTNLDHKKRHDNIDSKVPYIPNNYPLYDNYNAINIDRVKDIPCGYDGYMGVPISFLFKWNPEEFEILGITKNWDTCEAIKSDATTTDPLIDGKLKYARLIIRRL